MRKLESPAVQPEWDLILSAIRPCSNEQRNDDIARIAPHVLDWAFVFSTADRHHITLPLVRALHALSFPNVPQVWKDYSEVVRKSLSLRNFSLAAETVGVLRLLRDNGFLGIPYRGAALALRAYGDLGFREISGVDILVRERDINPIGELIREKSGDLPLPVRRDQNPPTQRRSSPQYSFPLSPVFGSIEFHTEKTLKCFPVPLDLDALERRLTSLMVANSTVSAFAPEDLLPILAVHGNSHSWERLHLIADVAWLARPSAQINWKLVFTWGRELGAERIIRVALHLAHKLLHLELVEEALHYFPLDSLTVSEVKKTIERLVRKSRKYSVSAKGKFPKRPVHDLAPFDPTPESVIERILDLAKIKPGDVLYDVGCGDGRIVVAAARRFGIRCVGIDLNPAHIREAKLLARRAGVSRLIEFRTQDATTIDLSQASVVTLYLTLAGNTILLSQLESQLQAGARIVSRDFAIPGREPERRVLVRVSSVHETRLMLWRVGRHGLSSKSGGNTAC